MTFVYLFADEKHVLSGNNIETLHPHMIHKQLFVKDTDGYHNVFCTKAVDYAKFKEVPYADVFQTFDKVDKCFNKYLVVMVINEIQFMTDDDSFADPKTTAYDLISSFDAYLVRPTNGAKLLQFLKSMEKYYEKYKLNAHPCHVYNIRLIRYVKYLVEEQNNISIYNCGQYGIDISTRFSSYCSNAISFRIHDGDPIYNIMESMTGASVKSSASDMIVYKPLFSMIVHNNFNTFVSALC